MKLLLDFLPIAVFFAAFKLADIYVATVATIVATLVQLGWMRAMRRPIEPMHWVGLAILVVFGGATLLLKDETYIKWKPTVLYLLVAGVLAGGRLVGRDLLKAAMGKAMTLPDGIWTRLNVAWVGFFVAMAALNLWVAFSFTLEQWVSFKLFGALGLTLAFVVAQAVYASRHAQVD